MYPARSEMIDRNGANALFSVILTVRGSTTVTWSMSSISGLRGEAFAGSRIQSKFCFTAFASQAVPSWNLTLARNLKTYVVGSGVVQDSARSGTILRFLSGATRPDRK